VDLSLISTSIARTSWFELRAARAKGRRGRSGGGRDGESDGLECDEDWEFGADGSSLDPRFALLLSSSSLSASSFASLALFGSSISGSSFGPQTCKHCYGGMVLFIFPPAFFNLSLSFVLLGLCFLPPYK
jgi:hypothetical protein